MAIEEPTMPGAQTGAPAGAEEDHEQENGNGVLDPSAERANLLGQIKKIRADHYQHDFYEDFVVPGYMDLVVMRVRPFPSSKSESKADALRRRMDRGEPILVDAAADTLIDACDQIMVRKTKDAEPIPIDDEVPVRFDERLIDLFGLQIAGEKKTSRKIVRALFLTDQSLIATSIAVTDWLKDVTRDADEEAMGE